jgi:2,3-bisphosphoglycerate-dependent phosphoglycerate mutase
MDPAQSTRRLILARHGQSAFNAQNRFTGWRDCPLTIQGEDEARRLARRLQAANIDVQHVFSSTLQRTVRSAQIIIADLGGGADLRSAQALNERDYGELTGLDKAQAVARWGADQVREWRRSYALAPPGGESLRDTVARVVPYYLREILPVVLGGANVLVVAHGNSLRALVSALDGLTPPQVEALEIATGELRAYDVAIDARTQPLPL